MRKEGRKGGRKKEKRKENGLSSFITCMKQPQIPRVKSMKQKEKDTPILLEEL